MIQAKADAGNYMPFVLWVAILFILKTKNIIGGNV